MSGCQTPPQVEGWSCLQWSVGRESAWGDVRLSDTTPGRRVVVSTVIWGNRESMGWCQTPPQVEGRSCLHWSGEQRVHRVMSGCLTPPQVEGRSCLHWSGEQRVHRVMSGCLTPPQVEGWSCLQWSVGRESAWGDIRLSDTTPGRGAVVSTVIWGTERAWGDVRLSDTTPGRGAVVSTVICGKRECMGWCQAVLHHPR